MHAAAVEVLGFTLLPEEQSVPWREAFPELTESKRPGVVLRGLREREGLTQVQLAKATGIPQHHISEMENAKRSIGKERAKKLALALRTDYRVFL